MSCGSVPRGRAGLIKGRDKEAERGVRWVRALGGRIPDSEGIDEDSDVWVNKHPSPNSSPRGSAPPFPGGLLTRVSEKGILVWRISMAGMPFKRVILEPPLGPQGSVKMSPFPTFFIAAR